jgi:hypothetical protein
MNFDVLIGKPAKTEKETVEVSPKRPYSQDELQPTDKLKSGIHIFVF